MCSSFAFVSKSELMLRFVAFSLRERYKVRSCVFLMCIKYVYDYIIEILRYKENLNKCCKQEKIVSFYGTFSL